MKKYFKVIILFFCCVVCLGFFLYKKRTSVYHYDVKKNYNYDFTRSGALTIPLDLIDGEIKMPPIKKNWDTAFLKLNDSFSCLKS